ncbi:MAG: CaiB/BaiF CoA transferase family protein [Vicinamibacteria bacterium]
MTGALAGTRVVDLTRNIPGPYCTMLLGDLGADVVKLEEPPYGDVTRVVPPALGDDSALHAALNRNKRSLVVDLRRPEGAEVVKRLASKADVLVEAFRPGVLDRRGLGSRELLEANPRLVYCSLTGYGEQGARADRAGHDVDYAAVGGLLALNRDASGEPVLPSVQIADMTGGLLAVIAVLAGLQARERSGRGSHVRTSLQGGMLSLAIVASARLQAGGSKANELSGAFACYNVYRCRDGLHLAVGALEPKFWEALCRGLGHEELISRQWERGEQARETVALFARLFATRDRDAWLAELQPFDCCVEPVLEPVEALREAGERLLRVPVGDAFLVTAGTPVWGESVCGGLRRPAPKPGEHADEILREAGYDAPGIAELRDGGVVL